MTIIAALASELGLAEDALLTKVREVSFKRIPNASNDEIYMFCALAHKHKINPLTELYAQIDDNGMIIPTLKIDGWYRVVNDHPDFDGVEFNYSPGMTTYAGLQHPHHIWCESVFKRKNLSHPIVVREFFSDNYLQESIYQNSWQTHPNRRLRHAAYIQGARMAFGLHGVYSSDEAIRIIESSKAVSAGKTSPIKTSFNAGVIDQIPTSTGENPSVSEVFNSNEFAGTNVVMLSTSLVDSPVIPMSIGDGSDIPEFPTMVLQSDVQPQSIEAVASNDLTEEDIDKICSNHLNDEMRNDVKKFINKVIDRAVKNGTWDFCMKIIEDNFPSQIHPFALKYYEFKKDEKLQKAS